MVPTRTNTISTYTTNNSNNIKTTTTHLNNFLYNKRQCDYHCNKVVTNSKKNNNNYNKNNINITNDSLKLEYTHTCISTTYICNTDIAICDKCDSIVKHVVWPVENVLSWYIKKLDFDHKFPRSCDTYVRNVWRMSSYFSQLWRIRSY